MIKMSLLLVLGAVTCVAAEDQMILKTELPKPLYVGTPVPIKDVPNLEPKTKAAHADILVPPGTVNLAKGKKVTASDSDPVVGSLDLITDGDKEGDEGSWVEFGPGRQWIQIDLEQEAALSAVVFWHFHSQERVYHEVVVQVSNDATFQKDVTTLFDDTVGTGKDLAYIESYKGKWVEAKGVKGRYVRLYSKGNTTNKMNHYIEVEVFGRPSA